MCRRSELVMLSLRLADPGQLLHLEWPQSQSHGWHRWHRRWLCPRGMPESRLTHLPCAILLPLSTLVRPLAIPKDAMCRLPCVIIIPKRRSPRARRSCLPKLICNCMAPLRWTRKCGLVAMLLDVSMPRTRSPRNRKNHCPRLTKMMRPRASSSLCRGTLRKILDIDRGITILLQYGYDLACGDRHWLIWCRGLAASRRMPALWNSINVLVTGQVAALQPQTKLFQAFSTLMMILCQEVDRRGSHTKT